MPYIKWLIFSKIVFYSSFRYLHTFACLVLSLLLVLPVSSIQSFSFNSLKRGRTDSMLMFRRLATSSGVAPYSILFLNIIRHFLRILLACTVSALAFDVVGSLYPALFGYWFIFDPMKFLPVGSYWFLFLNCIPKIFICLQKH